MSERLVTDEEAREWERETYMTNAGARDLLHTRSVLIEALERIMEQSGWNATAEDDLRDLEDFPEAYHIASGLLSTLHGKGEA